MTEVGVISDTHGFVRAEALAALAGVGRILHAGDVGSSSVLEALERVAPVTAVRGNVDEGLWAEALPETAVAQVEQVRIYILHRLVDLDFEPSRRGIGVVVSGHTHEAWVEERDGVLYLNPGSAGPRRFSLPLSVARLVIDGDAARARIVSLETA